MNIYDNEEKYKIYKKVEDILHPSISKKNLSDYKIIIDNSLFPIRVFYPKKITSINKIIIYIPDISNASKCSGMYTKICKILNNNLDTLVVALEYSISKSKYKTTLDKIYSTIDQLILGLSGKDIILMGDSTAGYLITNMEYLYDLKIKKQILFYPTLSLEYFGKTKYESITKYQEFNEGVVEELKKFFTKIIDDKKTCFYPLLEKKLKLPETLVIVGNADIVKDEDKFFYNSLSGNNKYLEIPFLSHGFLKNLDKEEEKDIINSIKKFIN